MHADLPSVPHHWRKYQVERALQASPLRWTILRPAMFAQTPFSFLNSAHTMLPVGFSRTAPFTPVHLEDLGEASARVLIEDGHDGATYELAGTERLSFEDMARVMSLAWDQTVRVRQLPPWLVAAVGARRFGPGARPLMKAMLEHYDAHGFVGTQSDLPRLLGHEPQTFADAVAALPARPARR